MGRIVRMLDRMKEQPDCYPVVKSIPIPPTHIKPGQSRLRTTLTAMDVGDSFLCSGSQRCHAYGMAKKLGIEVTSRVVGDKQLRVWRTK